jgi:DNA polymerase-3 subunit delta
MIVRPEQIAKHLQKQLLPVYLFWGEEPLIQQEATDTLRQHCRDNGFNEREVLDVTDNKFDWNLLLAAGNSLSLFAERRIIELRLEKKPDKNGGQAIVEFLSDLNPDNILIITAPKLDKRAKWYTTVDKLGAICQAWPVDRRDLPRWLGQRMQSIGLKADPQALQLIADRVEGNLLAAAQEVEKLRILADADGHISPQMVAQSVASSARYDIFKLIDNALQGNAKATLTMMNGLKAEGVELLPCLGAISRELRILYQCAWQVHQGANVDRVIDQNRVWDKRKPAYKAVLERNNLHAFNKLLKAVNDIDLAVKGRRKANPWDELAQLLQGLALGVDR